MARLLRLEFEGMLDHMMSRGNAREDILLDDEDRTAFLSLNPQRTRPDPAPRYSLTGWPLASERAAASASGSGVRSCFIGGPR